MNQTGVGVDFVGPKLKGDYKYAAAAVVGKHIYGIPANATRVLRIDGITGKGELVGPKLPGDGKYRSAVVVDRYIYGIPANAKQVLRINGISGDVDLIGPELEGADKYSCAVVVGKRVYAVPYDSQQFLRLDCSTNKVELMGPKLTDLAVSAAMGKQYLAAAVVDGSIYAMPWCARRVLRMKASTGEIDFIGPEMEERCMYKYAAVVDERIYAIPCHAKRVLCIGHSIGTCNFVGPEVGGEWKYVSGAVAGTCIYAFPLHAKQVLRIEGATGQVEFVGPHFEGHFKYSCGSVIGSSLYGIPSSATNILQVDGPTGKCDTLGPELPGRTKYMEGCAVAFNGSIHVVPRDAAQALRISPRPAALAPGDPQRAINRWGLNVANVLTGTHTFFPKGFVPIHSAVDCLRYISFARRDEVLRKAMKETAKEPDETRGYLVVIHAYTQEMPLYEEVNTIMRHTDEKLLEQWREYIYHMERALSRQPCFGGTVYRGIKVTVPRSVYEPGSTVTWQSFTSATRRVHVLLKFLESIVSAEGIKLGGTVFVIKSCNARCVEKISDHPEEEEVVFAANTHFKVQDMVEDEAGKRGLLPGLGYNLENLKVFCMVEL